jgi:serine protease Do
MKLYEQIREQKLLSTLLMGTTLAVGILIGTLVNTGVRAARDQQVAPDATPLVIPRAEEMGNEFTKLAKQLDASVVYIRADYTPKIEAVTHNRHGKQQQPQADPDEEDNGGGNQEGLDLFQRFFGNRGGGGSGSGGGGGMQQNYKHEQSGTGFVVDRKGYIITNHHVVSVERSGDPVDHIYVKLNGDDVEYRGRLIGSDSETDIAVIKIDPRHDLQPVHVGNSDGVQVGDWAVAIGSPFGLEASVTAGIVSAKGRNINGGNFQHFIQTDAAINPGNSGGPLLNIKGEVIGVNTMIATQNGGSQGVGFALPMNDVARLYNDIIRDGRVTRGSIGASLMPDTRLTLKAMGFDHGVIVDSVHKDGPAEKGGLKSQDIVLGFNGQAMKDSRDLIGHVADTPVGTPVVLNVDRDGKKMDLKVVIADRMKVYADDPNIVGRPAPSNSEDPRTGGPAAGQVKFGIEARPVSEEERELTPEKRGLTVTRVEPGSFAEEIGILEHDVIISVNRQPVASTDDVRKVAQTLKPGDAVAFRVVRSVPQRAPETRYLSGTLPER